LNFSIKPPVDRNGEASTLLAEGASANHGFDLVPLADTATALHSIQPKQQQSILYNQKELLLAVNEKFLLTHEQVAEKVGKTRSAITNSLRLLALPPSIQQLLADGRLSGGHARALLALTDRTTQEQLARQCANDGWTVRAVEEAVRQNLGRTKATSKTTSTNSSTTKTSTKSTTMPQPGLVELERLLGEHLATNVSVTSTNGRGKVVVEFADLNDLERIYRAMTEGPAVSD
jgi:ParB-like chromosome segregation protein Spo0J